MAKTSSKKRKLSVTEDVGVVGSAKEVVKAASTLGSGELVELASHRAHQLLATAVARASGHARRAVRPYDL